MKIKFEPCKNTDSRKNISDPRNPHKNYDPHPFAVMKNCGKWFLQNGCSELTHTKLNFNRTATFYVTNVKYL